MVTKIKLQPKGKKKQHCYDLVATEGRSKLFGEVNEKLGYYDPMGKQSKIAVNRERVIQWLENGAKMTHTARSIISKTGTLLDWHLKREIMKGKITEEKAREKKEEWEKASSKKTKNYTYKVL